MATVKTILVDDSKRLSPPKANDDLPFGKIHSNHMFVSDFLSEEGGWQAPAIMPFQPFIFYPDSVVFHYGQQIFEGLKAYRLQDNSVALFRPSLNAERFYYSAKRLGMEPVPTDLFLTAVSSLVVNDEDFLLPYPACLYIRPSLIPLDRGVNYRASKDYRFFVFACATKRYLTGHDATTVLVEKDLVRAAPGGTGDTKAGANYAQSVLALKKAKSLHADSVLWLDALEHRYVEEIGAMNIMFVYKDRIVTPPLNGTILPGVTRDSLIQLARFMGIEVLEERVDIYQVIEDIKNGHLTEIFGCGTAAVVSPIYKLIFSGQEITIPHQKISISEKLKKALEDIQFGISDDPFSWRVVLKK